jgi:hypothetical protein
VFLRPSHQASVLNPNSTDATPGTGAELGCAGRASGAFAVRRFRRGGRTVSTPAYSGTVQHQEDSCDR